MIDYATSKKYNLDNFNNYLKLQRNHSEEMLNVMSYEEFILFNNYIEIDESILKRVYLKYIGIDDILAIPEYLSFQNYCIKNELEIYKNIEYVKTK